MDIEYILATDFDRAWLNFELDLPLVPGPKGKPNPFYVDRPGNPAAQLEDELLAPYLQPPKFFFSGHRGCGKSTELRRISANPYINAKFWPIHFTIRDEADINDLDFRDVLLAIGSKLYRDYVGSGHNLPKQLLKDLDGWRGQIETEIKKTITGRPAEVEIQAGLEAFFANAGLKMKLEPATRAEIRQVFEHNITGLIKTINDITAAILKREKRMPLLLIDDLDKPDLEKAKQIFYGQREIMLQPQCAVVYTISSALFYSDEFGAIRDRAIFLPNIKLHPRNEPDKRYDKGYDTLREFVQKRMSLDLITSESLNEAITNSGGVFREMARVMRSAIGRARRRKASQIGLSDVQWAAAEIRNEYRRILDASDRQFLREVHEHNRLQSHDRLLPLLQLLALLEYRNTENWCDIHPALRELIKEDK